MWSEEAAVAAQVRRLSQQVLELQNRMQKIEEDKQKNRDDLILKNPSTFVLTIDETDRKLNESTTTGVKEEYVSSNKFDKLIEKYGDGLTMHGLNYIRINHAFECLFWVVVVTSCLGLLAYGLYSLTTRYRQFDVNQSITIHEPQFTKLPSFTICSVEAIDNYLYCYRGLMWNKGPCKNSTSLLHPRMISCARPRRVDSILPMPQLPPIPCSSSHVQSVHNGACITLNPEQTEMQSHEGFNGRVSYALQYPYWFTNRTARQSLLRVIIHNSDELPILTPGVGIEIDLNSTVIGRGFEISSHTEYRRLPPPHNLDGLHCLPFKPASLITANAEKFPCLQSCMFNWEIKKCRALNDLWRSYMPTDMQHNYEKTLDANKTLTCMSDQYMFEYGLKWKVCPDCPPLCERAVYKTSVKKLKFDSVWLHQAYFDDFFYAKDGISKTFCLDLWYDTLEYQVISESPKYPWFSFLAEFGGFLGLLTGCSAVSVIEIVVLLCLLVIKGSRNISEKRKIVQVH